MHPVPESSGSEGESSQEVADAECGFLKNFQTINIHAWEASDKTEERFGLDLGQRLPSPFTLSLGPDELLFCR